MGVVGWEVRVGRDVSASEDGLWCGHPFVTEDETGAHASNSDANPNRRAKAAQEDLEPRPASKENEHSLPGLPEPI